jgi:hypothetical protein
MYVRGNWIQTRPCSAQPISETTHAYYSNRRPFNAIGRATIALFSLVVLGQVIFIAGLAALDDDINGTCVLVKPDSATEAVCLSANFGIYYFIWVLQCVVYAGVFAYWPC